MNGIFSGYKLYSFINEFYVVCFLTLTYAMTCLDEYRFFSSWILFYKVKKAQCIFNMTLGLCSLNLNSTVVKILRTNNTHGPRNWIIVQIFPATLRNNFIQWINISLSSGSEIWGLSKYWADKETQTNLVRYFDIETWSWLLAVNRPFLVCLKRSMWSCSNKH